MGYSLGAPSPRPTPEAGQDRSAARRGTSRTAESCGAPSVSVPVLSNATTLVCASRSITTADLTSTPFRPAVAIAANNGDIVASTIAHGDATIVNVIARSDARPY